MPVKRIELGRAASGSLSSLTLIVSPSAMNVALASQKMQVGDLAPSTQGALKVPWADAAAGSASASRVVSRAAGSRRRML